MDGTENTTGWPTVSDEGWPTLDPVQPVSTGQQLQPQPPDEPAQQIQEAPAPEIVPAELEDLEAEAFSILSDAPDYNTATTQLLDYVKDKKFGDPTAATEVLAEYGDKFRWKHKEALFGVDGVMAVSPVPPGAAEGADIIEQVTDWETKNLKALSKTTDPEYLLVRNELSRQIKQIASETRREQKGGVTGEVPIYGWAADKFFRAASGITGPFAQIPGIGYLNQKAYEQTDPARDAGIAGKIASITGAIAPAAVAGAFTGGAGFVGVMGAQAMGDASQMYESSMATTGDPSRALAAAGLTASATLVGMVPVGRVASAFGKAVRGGVKAGAEAAALKGAATGLSEASRKAAAANVITTLSEKFGLQPRGFKDWARTAANAGTFGAVGAVIGNEASNIGLLTDNEWHEGVAESFLATAAAAGFYRAGENFAHNAAVYHMNKMWEAAKNPARPAPSSKKPIDLLQKTAPEKTEAYRQAEELGEAYTFKTDEDGYVDVDDTLANTPEHRQKELVVLDRLTKEAAAKPPVDDGRTVVTPKGEEVTFDYAPDEVIADAQLPERFMSTTVEPQANQRLNPYITSMAKAIVSEMGGDISLRRNIMDGALGSFVSRGRENGEIRVLRSLGADPQRLTEVLSHEMTHSIDFLLNAFENPKLQAFADKLKTFRELIFDKARSTGIYDEAKKVSMWWRPDWDGTMPVEVPEGAALSPGAGKLNKFLDYRSSPQEVFADLGGAFMHMPEEVARISPEVHKMMRDIFDSRPDLQQWYDEMQRIGNDPVEMGRYVMGLEKEGHAKHAELQGKAELEKAKKNSLAYRVARDAKATYQFLFNAFEPIKKSINTFAKDFREEAYDILNGVQRGGYASNYISRNIDVPFLAEWKKFTQEEIPIPAWGHYESANKLRNDKTTTMQHIEERPDVYREAAVFIRDLLKGVKGTPKALIDKNFSDSALSTTKGVQDALASINLIGDTSQVLDIMSYVKPNEDLNDSKVFQKATQRLQNAQRALARRKTSIPVEALRRMISKAEVSKDFKAVLEEVTTDNAFAARRYLINPYGETAMDADNVMATLAHDLGPEKFAKLEEYSDRFHKIVYDAMVPIARDSGIFSPEALSRIALNADSYVTNLVLKYFKSDESISPGLRAAIGSMDEVGNPLVATLNKTRAIISWGYRQRAINKAIEAATLEGLPADARESVLLGGEGGETAYTPSQIETIKGTSEKVSVVSRGGMGKKLWEMKESLSKKDKEASYLIGMKDGKATLYRIADGKGYEDAFKRVYDLPAFNFFLDMTEAANKIFLTKGLKTVFSPAWVLGQKFYDRKLEAIMANSFEITMGLPTHLGKLRAIDAQTRAEITHYEKTGELTGRLKEAIDRDAALLHFSSMENKALDTSAAVDNAVFEGFGTPLPKATESMLVKFGHGMEAAIDKLYGKRMKSIAAFDELRTKINGYTIGTEVLGMPPDQAAVFARENFGVPDPMGGGRAAPLINKMFLFGSVHFNGLRVLGRFLTERPKTAGTQVAYRMLMPKIGWMGPVMGAAMLSLGLKDESEKYVRLNQMVPSYDKMTRNGFILGAQDGQGKFHNLFDGDWKASDIQSDWKPWYVRLPQSREISTVAYALWPFFEHLFEGEPIEAMRSGAKGAAQAATANVQPMVQYATNAIQLALGYNPTDFWRQKDIFSPTLQLGGSEAEKAVELGHYVLASHFPSIVPYNPVQTSRTRSGTEQLLQSVPFLSPLARNFIGISNWGLVERNKDLQLESAQDKAALRNSMDDATQTLLSENSAVTAQISTIGKGYQAELGPTVTARAHALATWYRRVWTPFRQTMEHAVNAGDDEQVNALRNNMAESSKAMLAQIQSLYSTVSPSTSQPQAAASPAR